MKVPTAKIIPRNPNLCQFVFCRCAWTAEYMYADAYIRSRAWAIRLCDKHGAPYREMDHVYVIERQT